MGKTRKDYLFEDWVEFHLNPDDCPESKVYNLNAELARVFGKDRDSQSQFLSRVSDEVSNIQKSALRVDYDTAWDEAHAEKDRRLRLEHLANRAKCTSFFEAFQYSDYCDKLGEVPKDDVEKKIYDLGVIFRERYRRDEQ